MYCKALEQIFPVPFFLRLSHVFEKNVEKRCSVNEFYVMMFKGYLQKNGKDKERLNVCRRECDQDQT